MIRVLTAFLLFFGFLYASDKDLKLFDRIIVVVNGQPVLQSELEIAMQWFGISDKKEAVKKLIDQIIVAQAAEKLGIRVDPKEIDEAVLRIAKANKMEDIQQFKKKLIEQGFSYTEFRDLIKRELLIRRYIQVHLRRTLFGGIKEGKLVKVRKVRIIFLSTSNRDFKDKYNYLVKNLKAKNFSELAKKYSDDPVTAEKGGLLGEVQKGDLIKKLDEQIWERKIGDIFEVPVENGIYFVLIESEKEKMLNQELSGEEIAKKLKDEYQIQLNKLRERAVIQYLDKSLM
ncbi:peptidylprolyl isomerase [Persephonella sp.]|uniref:peptidylprolyl isomerase n=1 Tax=Persephonella sp. TaxID=2060922 RepID=UPI0025FC7350|nr:peptidylprolyl isomerase [Persephonella sp.]